MADDTVFTFIYRDATETAGTSAVPGAASAAAGNADAPATLTRQPRAKKAAEEADKPTTARERMAEALRTLITDVGGRVEDKLAAAVKSEVGGPLANLVQTVYAEIKSARKAVDDAPRPAAAKIAQAEAPAPPAPKPEPPPPAATQAAASPQSAPPPAAAQAPPVPQASASPAPPVPTTATRAAAAAPQAPAAESAAAAPAAAPPPAAAAAAAPVASAAGAATEAAVGAESAAAASGVAALAVACAPAAIAIAGLAVGAVVVKKAWDAVAAAATERAQELRRFSGTVAAAEARIRVADILLQQRQGRRIGEDVANFREASAGTSRELARLKDAILQPLLRAMLPLAEGLSKLVGFVASIAEVLSPALEVVIRELGLVTLGLKPLVLIWQFLQWLRSWLPGGAPAKGAPGLLEQFMRMG